MKTQRNNKNNKNKNKHSKTRKNIIPKYYNDFYSNINFNWLKNITIKKNNTSVNEFVLRQDKIEKYLQKLIENTSISNPISHIYTKFQKYNNTETENVFHDMINQLDNLRTDKTNIWSFLCLLDKNMINQPFNVNISHDDKDYSKFIVYIDSGGIPFDTRKYYFNMGKYEKIRKKY